MATYVLGEGVPAMVLFGRLMIAIALAGTVWSTLCCYPRQLAYFNELAGGPTHGWRLMLGSSVDWGQNAFAIDQWLATHGTSSRPPIVSYRVNYDCADLIDSRIQNFDAVDREPVDLSILGTQLLLVRVGDLLESQESPDRTLWSEEQHRILRQTSKSPVLDMIENSVLVVRLGG